jgi:hypothetical protein
VHLSRKAGHPQGGPVVRCGFCAAPLWGSPAPRGAGNPLHLNRSAPSSPLHGQRVLEQNRNQIPKVY